MACLGVELLAVAEVGTQPRADEEPVAGIDAEIAAVEQGVDVGSQQQSVVEAVLATVVDRADVGGLQDWRDVRSGDGAPPMICVEDNGAERVLPEPVGR